MKRARPTPEWRSKVPSDVAQYIESLEAAVHAVATREPGWLRQCVAISDCITLREDIEFSKHGKVIHAK